MIPLENRFEGRAAIVTGGASGLGFGVARRMIAEGGRVSLWDVNAPALAEAAAAIGAHDRQVVDTTDLAAVEAAMKSSVRQLGAVDIVINGAGITGATAPLHEFPPDSWYRVLDVNLNGTFHVCRTAIPHLLNRGYGRIVNVASVAGKEGNPNASAYSASKGAVIALTKSLAKEVATHGITVNTIAPATFDSPILNQLPPTQIDYMRARIPIGRLGTVDENVAMICFMASEECSFTTGATFDTSGGRCTY